MNKQSNGSAKPQQVRVTKGYQPQGSANVPTAAPKLVSAVVTPKPAQPSKPR